MMPLPSAGGADRAGLTGIDVADCAVRIGRRNPGRVAGAEERQVGIGVQGDREAVIRVREGRVRQAGDRVEHGHESRHRPW